MRWSKTFFITTTILLLAWKTALAIPSPDSSFNSVVSTFLQNIFRDNVKHITKIDPEQYQAMMHQQTPRATVLMCSDSRVQANAFNKTPVNDLFFIRNIGNQINTAAGSVEYGVNHLHTPIVLIVGHSGCGAIDAAQGDFSRESLKIQQELKSLNVKSDLSLRDNIINNVNHQVQIAMAKFKDLVRRKKLTIIGVVYDFRNDFKQGFGQLILININGETSPQKLASNPNLKQVKNVIISDA